MVLLPHKNLVSSENGNTVLPRTLVAKGLFFLVMNVSVIIQKHDIGRMDSVVVSSDIRSLEIQASQGRSKGGGRGGRAPPPPSQLFSQKVKTDLYKMLKIKFYLPRGLKQ